MEMKDKNQSAGSETRRSFIKKAATAAAVATTPSLFTTPVYGQNQAPSANVAGANDKLVLGVVGLGGQGSLHLRNFLAMKDEKNLAIGAVCDLWTKRPRRSRRQRAQPAAGKKRKRRRR